MRKINIREALLELDKRTSCQYDLTTLYEACKLNDEDKNQLVKYIDAYDHPSVIGGFLASKCEALSEELGDDDVSDLKLIDDINCGEDHTLWSLADKLEDDALELKELTEDIAPDEKAAIAGRVREAATGVLVGKLGYEEDFVDDCMIIDVDDVDDNTHIKVEVRAEVDYDGLMTLGQALDPIVKEYDKNAYFEPVTSGIMSAYIRKDQSGDIPDEAAVKEWTDRFNACQTKEDVIAVYRDLIKVRDNNEVTWGTIEAIYDVIDAKMDSLGESLTEATIDINNDYQLQTPATDYSVYEPSFDVSKLEVGKRIKTADSDNPVTITKVYSHPQYNTYGDVQGISVSNGEYNYDIWFDNETLRDRGLVGYKLKNIILLDESLNEASFTVPTDREEYCPHCCNLSLKGVGDGRAVCDSCGAEYEVTALGNDKVRLDPLFISEAVSNDEWFVGDNESGRMYKGKDAAQKAYDRLVKSGIKDAVMKPAEDESLTTDDSEWFVGDGASGYMYKGKEAAQKAYDNLVKSGVKNAVMHPAEDESLTETTENDGWVKRWNFLDNYYKDDLVISKISSPTNAWHVERVAPNGHTKEHLGNFNSLEAAKASVSPKKECAQPTRLTLSESDDTDILYDMEDYGEDNTTVIAGNSFVEDGHEWTWFKQCGDTVHLDFDNWAVWWAFRPEIDGDENSTAISGFFIVDTDTGFIDWGPCDTEKEAQEFLQSKVNDWENDDLDESKSISEEIDSNGKYVYGDFRFQDSDSSYKTYSYGDITTEYITLAASDLFNTTLKKQITDAGFVLTDDYTTEDGEFISYVRKTKIADESKSIKEGTFHWNDSKAAYETVRVKKAIEKYFNRIVEQHSQGLRIKFPRFGVKDAEKAGITVATVGKLLNSIGYKYTGVTKDDDTEVHCYIKDDVEIQLYEIDYAVYTIYLDFDSEVYDRVDIDTTGFSSYVNTNDVDAVQDLLFDIVTGYVKTLGDISISEEDAKNIKKLCGGTLDMCTHDFARYSDDIVDKVDDYFAMKQYQELHNKHVDESKSIKEDLETFNSLKQKLADGAFDNYVAYDSEYSDFIDALYNDAVAKLEKEYKDLYIEPSIQSGRGSVFASYDVDGETYYCNWNYEYECEAIEEYIDESNNEEEFVNHMYNYLKGKLEDASTGEDDIDESIKEDASEKDVAEELETLLRTAGYDGGAHDSLFYEGNNYRWPEVKQNTTNGNLVIKGLCAIEPYPEEKERLIDTEVQKLIDFLTSKGYAIVKGPSYNDMWNSSSNGWNQSISRMITIVVKKEGYDFSTTKARLKQQKDEMQTIISQLADTPGFNISKRRNSLEHRIPDSFTQSKVREVIIKVIPSQFDKQGFDVCVYYLTGSTPRYQYCIGNTSKDSIEQLKQEMLNWCPDYSSDNATFIEECLAEGIKEEYFVGDDETGRIYYNEKDANENIRAVANRLFNSLKEYGANKITKYVDVYQIYFNNSEDDSDATLIHYDIQSEGFKEVAQYGDEPNVTEYVNEDGTVCAKLLIYEDSISVEVSKEDASQYNESLKESVEKYIIGATERGLNLYYNAKEDHMSTDMKAATQYAERAVALDDYKAVKERYPTAYIRSTYDLPLLNKPTTKVKKRENEV